MEEYSETMMVWDESPAEGTLDVVDLTEFELDTVPEELVQRGDRLGELVIGGNSLSTLPDWLPQLRYLQELDLSNNVFQSLPSVLCDMPHLRVLNMKNNQLGDSSLPKQIGRLTRLEILNISGNGLTRLPCQLFAVTSLRELYLGSNRLRDVSRRIVELTMLEVLYLGGNNLTHVPAELGLLQELQCLNLSDNKLETVPVTLSNLGHLRSLSLHDNQLQTLPEDILKLDRLVEFSLRNNPLLTSFIRNFDWQVPSLKELAGRTVKAHEVPYSRDTIPNELVAYLASAHECVNPRCRGVYFASRVGHVKFVDFCGKFRLPLLEFLCSPKCTSAKPVVNAESGSDNEDRLIRRVLLG